MHHTVKPKLGNAAQLFAHESQTTKRPMPLHVFARPSWSKYVVVLLVALSIGALLNNHLSPFNEGAGHAVDSPEAALANVQLVGNAQEGDVLVGTLIHSDTSTGLLSITDPQRSVTLTPKERERLLQIISN